MQASCGFEDADRYASYLATPAGRMRIDLAWETLRLFLPPDASGRSTLDLGGGTGVMSARLAAAGFHVVLFDASEPMLAVARRQVAPGTPGRISFRHAEASQVCELFAPGSFDVVVCHNVLEYVREPSIVIRDIRSVLRPNGIASILVRNRAGEALKNAIRTGDPNVVEATLSAETILEPLFGQSVRLFTPADLREMIVGAGFGVAAERGVRVFSDYIAPGHLADDAHEQIFEMEHTLGARPEFAAVARYTHIIAVSGATPAE